MAANNDSHINIIKEYSKDDYYEYLQEKVKQIRAYKDREIRIAIKHVNPEPGFVLAKDEKESLLEDLCQICNHLPKFASRCGSCSFLYCNNCMFLLVTLTNIVNGRSPKSVSAENIYNKEFQCIRCGHITLSAKLTDQQKSVIKSRKVICNRFNCGYTNLYVNTLTHTLLCKSSGSSFRFDTTYLGEIFQARDQPLFDRSYCTIGFVQCLNQPNDSIGTEWVKRFGASLKEIEINDPEFEEAFPSNGDTDEIENEPTASKRSRTDPNVNTTQLQKDKEIWDGWDPEKSSSGTKLQASTEDDAALTEQETNDENRELIEDIEQAKRDFEIWNQTKGPAFNKRERRRRNKLRKKGVFISAPVPSTSPSFEPQPSTSQPQISTSNKPVYLPPSSVPVDERIYDPIANPKQVAKDISEFKTAAARRNRNKRHKNKTKWNLKVHRRHEQITKEILNRYHRKALKEMAPPPYYARRLTNAACELKDLGLKVCSLDAEMVRVIMRNNVVYHVPVWLAITDGVGNVVYHEFVRHTKKSYLDWDKDKYFHGLELKDIAKAKGFKTVKREVMNIFRQYDRIIVCGQTVDFASLFLSLDDYYAILPKLICINSYYNCYLNADGIGLKYIVYILFNKVIQYNVHSPLVDAAYTLYCYLYDFARIEQYRKLIINRPLTAKGHGFKCHKYDKNHYFAGRLHAIMS